MSGYIIADVVVTDEAQMKVYREWSSRAMTEFGAELPPVLFQGQVR